MQTQQVGHVLILPGDNTASTVREPNSALSDTRQEPPIRAGPLRCPDPVSSVPVTSESTKTLKPELNFGTTTTQQQKILQRSAQKKKLDSYIAQSISDRNKFNIRVQKPSDFS